MPRSVATTFECAGDQLVGIFAEADKATSIGLVIVVGGPQYRVGSHRQFTLLSRDLAAAGITTFRFDHRGIGDSSGETNFEQLEPDIRAAVDTFFARYSQLKGVVLWGLCDAASAVMMYAPTDPRVRGLVILNPWVRDERTQAQSYISGYYLKRFMQQEFWRGMISGDVRILASIRGFWRNLRLAGLSRIGSGGVNSADSPQPSGLSFQTRMIQGLEAFDGSVLLILSGNDLTAHEFRIFTKNNRRLRRILQGKKNKITELPDADHTFSTDKWRRRVADLTKNWIQALP